MEIQDVFIEANAKVRKTETEGNESERKTKSEKIENEEQKIEKEKSDMSEIQNNESINSQPRTELIADWSDDEDETYRKRCQRRIEKQKEAKREELSKKNNERKKDEEKKDAECNNAEWKQELKQAACSIKTQETAVSREKKEGLEEAHAEKRTNTTKLIGTPKSKDGRNNKQQP